MKKHILNVIILVSLFTFGSAVAQSEGEHTSFLLDHTIPENRNIERAMNYLSPNFNVADRKAIRDAIKRNGGNIAYIFLSNEGDNRKSGRITANINPYTSWSRFGDSTYLDPAKIAGWKKLIQKELIDEGLKPIFWMLADQSPSTGITNDGTSTRAELQNYFITMVQHFDGLAQGYVIGLEVEEYLERDDVDELAKTLKGVTNKSIGIHFKEKLRNGTDLAFVQQWTARPEIDTYYHQYGFNKTPAQIKAATEYYLPKLRSSLRFVASEYCLESDTPACQALGDAAIAGGAQHTGNGRTPPPNSNNGTQFIRYKNYLIPVN